MPPKPSKSEVAPEVGAEVGPEAGPEVVEERARAHVVTDGPEGHRAIRVALRYDPAHAPGAVRLSYPGSPRDHEWTFARELLERGLSAPAASGDVRVWPCGRAQTVIEFHMAHEVAVLQFDCAPLLRFLRRTHGTAGHSASGCRTPVPGKA